MKVPNIKKTIIPKRKKKRQLGELTVSDGHPQEPTARRLDLTLQDESAEIFTAEGKSD